MIGGEPTSNNNRLPPSLTSFAPGTPGTSSSEQSSGRGTSESYEPSDWRVCAGRGNLERYVQAPGGEIFRVVMIGVAEPKTRVTWVE